MFEDMKSKHAEKSRARHEARCAAGKHDWYLYSSSTMEYSYSSVGGCNPAYTEEEYRCRWCDASETRSTGNYEEYLQATGGDQQ